MHTSLVILIVLVIVVLIVILMTSPTCKNAVASVLKGQKVEKGQNSSSRQKVANGAPSGVDSSRLTPQAHAVPDFSKIHEVRTARRKLHVPSTLVQAPATVSKSGERVAKLPRDLNTDHQVKSKQFHVLSGNVLDMFNQRVDLEREFGLTENDLNRMAQDYKKRHLDVAKEPITRHRSVIRDQVDGMNDRLTAGFMANAKTRLKPEADELLINSLEDAGLKLRRKERRRK
jgi:hypothetical protein